MFKVYEIKGVDFLNDRYFENYEAAKENLEYRLNEMTKSAHFLEFEKVSPDEFINKGEPHIKEMYYVFARSADGDQVLTILIMKENCKCHNDNYKTQ